MASRETQVNLRVTATTKDEWDTFIEGSRSVDGLSDLIRRSVWAYIQADGDPAAVDSGGGGGHVPSAVTERLAALEDELDGLGTTLDRVDESVGLIERQLLRDESGSMSDALLRAIPPAVPTTDEWADQRDRLADHPAGEPIVWAGTVEAFAEDLDVDASLVEQSLDALLERENPPISVTTIEGERRFYAPRDVEVEPFADGRTRAAERRRERASDRQAQRR